MAKKLKMTMEDGSIQETPLLNEDGKIDASTYEATDTSNLVKKEEGKGLSTNDFDNASKTALAAAKSSASTTDYDTTLSSLLASLQSMMQLGRVYEGRTFIQLNFTTGDGFKSFVSGTIDFFGYGTGDSFYFQLTGPFAYDRIVFLTFECRLDTSYSLTLNLVSDMQSIFSTGNYVSGEFTKVIRNGVNSKVEIIY